MGQNEFTAWLFSGGGQELYNDLLQKELKMDVVAHFTTIQPFWEAFGWLKKPMNNLGDLQKLKFRSSGIGLEMFKRMGISTVGMAGGDIVPSLERGVIDGAEWAIPSRDIVMGFQQAAKYYYMPSFRQPPTFHELIINKKRWAELPPDLQAIVKYATMAEITRLAAYTVDQDSKAAEELATKHGVNILRTPDEVLRRGARGHRQGLRRRGAEEPVLCQGSRRPARVREEDGGPRAEDDPTDGHRGAALLAEEVAASSSLRSRRPAGRAAPR